MGIDVYFEENTQEDHFAEQIALWEKLDETRKIEIYKKIREQNLYEINQFMLSLQLKLERKINKVYIWMMYGKQFF
jgi:UTP-glucose-1-phosphate uridylyltransferase